MRELNMRNTPAIHLFDVLEDVMADVAEQVRADSDPSARTVSCEKASRVIHARGLRLMAQHVIGSYAVEVWGRGPGEYDLLTLECGTECLHTVRHDDTESPIFVDERTAS